MKHQRLYLSDLPSGSAAHTVHDGSLSSVPGLHVVAEGQA